MSTTAPTGSARKIAQIMQALETETDQRQIDRLHAALERERRRPGPAPARELPAVSPTEARARLKALVDARPTVSLAALSRMIGRRDGYLSVFVREGYPTHLARRDRDLLAAFLRVGEHELGPVEPAD
jgi:hypothetical protein